MSEVLTFNIDGTREATGLPRTTIYGLIRNGVFETRKCGRRTLIVAESVRRYLDSLPPAGITVTPKKAA